MDAITCAVIFSSSFFINSRNSSREAFPQEIGNRHYPIAPLRFFRIPFGVNAYLMNCVGGVARPSAIALDPYYFLVIIFSFF